MTRKLPSKSLKEVVDVLDDLYAHIDQVDEENLDKEHILSEIDPLRYILDDHINVIEDLMH